MKYRMKYRLNAVRTWSACLLRLHAPQTVQSRTEMVESFIARLESIGLPSAHGSGSGSSSGGGGVGDEAAVVAVGIGAQEGIQRSVVQSRIRKALGEGGRIRLPRLFGGSGSVGTASGAAAAATATPTVSQLVRQR